MRVFPQLALVGRLSGCKNSRSLYDGLISISDSLICFVARPRNLFVSLNFLVLSRFRIIVLIQLTTGSNMARITIVGAGSVSPTTPLETS